MNITLFPPTSVYETGRRDNQEDSIFPALGEATCKDRVFVLCDGMGGHEHGEVASQTVCDTIPQYLQNHWPEDGRVSDQLVKDAIEAAYRALDGKDDGAAKRMGTTLTLVILHNGGCTAAHIGDSRIYHLRTAEGKVLYRSRDHSLVFDLYQAGEITFEEMSTSKQKNIITKAMQPGTDHRCKPDIVHIGDLRDGDYIYMCSDGMLEHMDDDELADILCSTGSDDEKSKKLIRATKDNSDNHSAHLIHIQQVTKVEGEKVADDEATTRVNALNILPTVINAIEVEEQATTPMPKEKNPTMPMPHGKNWLWMVVAALTLVAILAVYILVSGNQGKAKDNNGANDNSQQAPTIHTITHDPQPGAETGKNEKQSQTWNNNLSPNKTKEPTN